MCESPQLHSFKAEYTVQSNSELEWLTLRSEPESI